MNERASFESSYQLSESSQWTSDKVGLLDDKVDLRDEFSPRRDDLEARMNWSRSQHGSTSLSKALRTSALVVIGVVVLVGTFHAGRMSQTSSVAAMSIPTNISGSHPFSSYAGSEPLALLKELYHPMKVPITQESFQHYNGSIYETYNISRVNWKSPLGKQVLIIDMDDRPMDTKEHIFHKETMLWEDASGHASSMLDHYSYGKTKGLKTC